MTELSESMHRLNAATMTAAQRAQFIEDVMKSDTDELGGRQLRHNAWLDANGRGSWSWWCTCGKGSIFLTTHKRATRLRDRHIRITRGRSA